MSDCPKFTDQQIKEKIYSNTNDKQQTKAAIYARAVRKKITNQKRSCD